MTDLLGGDSDGDDDDDGLAVCSEIWRASSLSHTWSPAGASIPLKPSCGNRVRCNDITMTSPYRIK